MLKYITQALFITSVVIFSLLATDAKADRLWFEYGIGYVTVGYNPESRIFVNNKIYVAAVGPDTTGTELHNKTRSCFRKIFLDKDIKKYDFGEKLRTSIWALANEREFSSPFVTFEREEYFQGLISTADALAKVFENATSELRLRLTECVGQEIDDYSFDLALIHRSCGTTGKNCKKSPSALNNHPASRAFSLLTYWVNNSTDVTKNFQPNMPIRIINGKPKIGESILEIKEATKWPEPPSSLEFQKYFEYGALKLREKSEKYSVVVPLTIDTTQQVASSLIDVIDNPVSAITMIKSVEESGLSFVSNELARTRIIECAQFQGARDINELRKCAGFDVPLSTLIQCVGDSTCRPKVNNKTALGILTLSGLYNDQNDLTVSLLPRMKSLPPYGQMVDIYNNCKLENISDTLTSECFLSSSLDGDEKRIFECFNSNDTNLESLRCSLKTTNQASLIEITNCMGSGDEELDALCLIDPSISDQIIAVEECMDGENGYAKCIGRLTGSEDINLILDCIEKYEDDSLNLALCSSENQLSPEIKIAISCVQSNDGEAASMAGCLITSGLPKDYQKAAQCLVEGGGDPIGTSVCMASDGLTPEQQIALQCAASSGGEPISFATCAAGRLTMKELAQCANKKFAEGNCFGENNEFRKLSRQLLGTDIGPNSVVADVANIHLESIKLTLVMAQEAGKGVENVLREAEALGKNVDRTLQTARDDVRREINNGLEALGDAAGGVICTVLGC